MMDHSGVRCLWGLLPSLRNKPSTEEDMKTPRLLTSILVPFLFCVILAGTGLVSFAQQPPPTGCCTPEATARAAESGKTIGVANVSLGMTAEEALPALKAVNASFKINVNRLDANWDYKALITQDSMIDPKKRWLLGLDTQTPRGEGDEQFQVQFTSPPSKPYVFNIHRQVDFAAQGMPTVENVLAGLRKRYGPESVHPIASGERLVWFFDEQGRTIQGVEATRIQNNPQCHAQEGTSGPDLAWNTLAAPSPYQPVVGSAQCLPLIIVDARITPAQTGSPLARAFAISVTDYPLYNNGANTTYGWLNQIRKQIASKQLGDAEKRGATIKY